jgi:tRNA dimethylallyltransferase
MPSMRCVGYRQAWEALDDGSAPAMAVWPERAVAATRQLAKRQLTWLRGLPQRRVVVAESDGAVDEVVRLATSAWTEAGNPPTLGRPQAS